MGAVRSLVVAALLIFNFLVTIAAIIAVYYGLTLKGKIKDGKSITKDVDNLYTWSIILAIAIGFNLLIWFATVVKQFSGGGKSMSYSKSR